MRPVPICFFNADSSAVCAGPDEFEIELRLRRHRQEQQVRSSRDTQKALQQLSFGLGPARRKRIFVVEVHQERDPVELRSNQISPDVFPSYSRERALTS